MTRYNTTLTICMSEEYSSGNVKKHRGLLNFQIKGPLTQRQRFRKTKQKRTFVRLDVKIKRDSLRLIKMREFNELSIIKKKSKLHSVIDS